MSLNGFHLKKCPLALLSFITLMAGGLFSFALAPYGYWWLALLSPACLYACLNERSAPQAFILGWCYGIGLWFVGAFWLYTSIHEYGDTSSPVSVLLIGLLALVMGLFSAVSSWVYKRFFPETPLTFTPIWILFEWLKTWLFTGFPWLFVGYAFTQAYLDAYAPLLGVFGVSFVAVFIATACVELFKKRFFWLIPILIVLLGAWGASLISFVTPKADQPLSVSLIQGNIPQDLKWQEAYQYKTLDIYSALSASEWGRDLVLWPESSIPMLQTSVQPFIDQVTEHARQTGSAWGVGMLYYDVKASEQAQQLLLYNALMLSGQNASGLYKKQRLVPFGEYIPMAGLLKWVLPALQNDPSGGGMSAGQAPQPHLTIKHHALGVAICYEVAYPNLTRLNAIGSDYMTTISNDAWFTGTAGPWQHLQMVQMRAKENGRWFMRATNTGVTAFINEHGQIVAQAPQDKALVLRHDVPAFTGQTMYSRLGDSPILLFSVILLVLGWYYRPRSIDVSFKSRR
ncbi:apolipoprotein N-acyltransferase [Acinetobacter sp. B5B]|uniref:apolipoprotein N-acyltransferase n=1 Tax=Acinetobacter baretiae TaxID=2605383 RepID=UPI0018C2735C|nr:apolipoprotein N-acyltransferase [Acinetobacter baretiae]MBF7682279.1 apolipoprotein N-acyltransferase [Acinetobacter baretiae]MBF7685107.1 apolipoprotein N-acyltransferase [Acinetobacter baretiae]